MENLNDKIAQLARSLGKNVPSSASKDYQDLRKEYERLANQDVARAQQASKQQRIARIHGQSDLNANWTFANLQEDSQDVIEAISIAKSFIAAHADPAWRKSGSHMMIFYGDYGRGKSHIAGAIAHELIDRYEISVLYRQLSTLLEMRYFSYDFQSEDKASMQFRQITRELMDVDLLILDEVAVNESMLKKNAQSWLGNLLRQRLANHKNCILITNHSLQELERALGTYCFESIREYDTYKVKFSGPSRREALADDDLSAASPTSAYQPNQIR